MLEYEYEKRQSHLCFSTEISSQAEVYRIPIWSQMVTGEWEIWLAFHHLISSVAHCFNDLLPHITEDPRRGGLKKHWFIIPHDSVGWLGFISCVLLGLVVQVPAGTSAGLSLPRWLQASVHQVSLESQNFWLPRRKEEAATLLKTWTWKSKDVAFATSHKIHPGSREHKDCLSLESVHIRRGRIVEGRLWRLVTTPTERGCGSSVTGLYSNLNSDILFLNHSSIFHWIKWPHSHFKN